MISKVIKLWNIFFRKILKKKFCKPTDAASKGKTVTFRDHKSSSAPVTHNFEPEQQRDLATFRAFSALQVTFYNTGWSRIMYNVLSKVNKHQESY